MKRRKFIHFGAAASIIPMVTSPGLASVPSERNYKKEDPFNLNYASHFGMFENAAGKDLLDQIQFMYDHGIRSLEDNGMKSRPIEEQEAIAQKMEKLGMQMGVFVANKISWKEPTLTTGKKEYEEEFLKDIKASVEVAKRVNAKWMTVVPGHVDLGVEIGYQTANLIDLLRKSSEILEPHGLVVVLEPLNWWKNHAGQFLSKIPQAYEICRAVDSPSCKILFDIYHQQIQEGNIIPNIDMAYDEIGYFQIGDNPGRNEPTTGEINYLNIFRHIHSKGFKGILGMEHGNSMPGKEGEMAVLEAYRKVDRFL